jgi:hypothetical protein
MDLCETKVNDISVSKQKVNKISFRRAEKQAKFRFESFRETKKEAELC